MLKTQVLVNRSYPINCHDVGDVFDDDDDVFDDDDDDDEFRGQ